MEKTIEKAQSRHDLHLLNEIAFAVYFPLLLIMVNILRSVQHPYQRSWVEGLQSLYGGRHFLPYKFAFGLLLVIAAFLLFLCLRVTRRLLASGIVFRIFAGIVAVAGFPIAAGYISFLGYFKMFSSPGRALLYAYAPHRWLTIEVIISVACVALYVFRKWKPSGWYSVFLLSLHFGIWSWIVSAGGQQSQLIYLLSGFPVSIAWGLDAPDYNRN